ncbi:hypothetical protein LG204_10300 [Methylovorus menthalis]|uniref:hypothetical protein n=1 Tax=Methylovorus menthalis TaxID=1002227 RepID=UPI001E56A5FF|nr:hypothetical protein [Methylovorus menthalis]MCB4811705.1 hypothetical protein [Methylovorus menthalis]
MTYSQNFDSLTAGANVNTLAGWVNEIGSGLTTSSSQFLSSGISATVISNSANNGDSIIYNGLGSLTDTKMRCAFFMTGGAAGSIRARFHLRSNGSNQWYEAFVTLAQTPYVTIRKRLAGVDQSPFTLAGAIAQSISSGNWYYIEWECVGSGPVTIRAKVWLASGTEPTDWEVVATDTSDVIAAGYPGIRLEYSTSANKSYADNFTVTDLSAGTLAAGGVSFSGTTSSGTTITAAAASGGTGPYNYQFQRAPDSSGSPGTFANIGSNSTATVYNDTGLSASTKYHYRVIVTDTVSATATGDSNSVTTTGASAVVAGTASVSSVGDTTASVTSTAPSGGVTTITNQWYRSTVPNVLGAAVPGATSLTLNDTGLTNGVDYYYTLVSTDGTTSANSKQISAVPAKTIFIGIISDSWATTTCTTGSTSAATTTSAAGNILNRKLQAMFKDGTKVTVLNRGIGGTNGSNWQGGGANLTNALAAMAAIASPSNWDVTDHLGVNDSSMSYSSPLGGETKAQYKAFQQNICNAVLAWGARRMILHKPPFIGDISANHNALGIALLKQYGDAIDELAAENPGKVFVGADEYKYFINNQGDLGGDKVHPTPADGNGAGGAPNVATMWAEAIYNIVSGKKTPNVRY